MRCRLKFPATVLLVVLVTTIGVSQEADFRTRVGIIPVRNATGEDAYDAVATTVSDTVGLVLRLLGEFAVTEAYDEPTLAQVDIDDPEAVSALAQELRFEEVVFGAIVRNEANALEFRLSLYNREAAEVLYEPTAVAPSIFEVFDAADEITIALVSQMSDVRIGFGELRVELESGSAPYRVFLGDTLIRNPDADLENVLNGTYELTIRQDRVLGETVIHREEIDIIEDEITVVRFSIPPAQPDEIAHVRRQGERLEQLAADPQQIDAALEALAEYQALARQVAFDPELDSISRTLLDASLETAAETIRSVRDEADSLYFADTPDFEAARNGYARFARLIAEPYDALAADAPRELENPGAIVALGDGAAVVTGPQASRRLVGIAPDLTVRFNVPLAGAGSRRAALAAGPDGRLYVTWPEAPDIRVFSATGELVEEIAVAIESEPGFNGNRALAVSPAGEVYVFEDDGIMVLNGDRERDDAIETALRETLGALESAPDYALFGPDGLLHLYDDESDTVIRTDFLGRPVSTVTLAGARAARGFTIDGLLNYYLADTGNHRVFKFSPEGERLAMVGEFGSSPGRFRAPEAVAARIDGSLFVSDTASDRVQLLERVGPPIQFGVIAEYGEQFQVRQAVAGDAVQRMEIVQRSIRPELVVGGFTGSLVSFAGSLGLFFLGEILLGQMYDEYETYQSLSAPTEVGAARNRAEQLWLGSRGAVAGGALAVGVTSFLLTDALLRTSEYAGAEREAITQLQAFDLDSTYEVDPARWRSLEVAATIGTVTGVVPPILSLSWLAAVQLTDVPELDELYYPMLLGSVAVPPIFSHAWGGEFHLGLFLAGLIADALVGAAWWVEANRDDTWAPSNLPGGSTGILNGMYRQLQTTAPLTLALGAIGVRFTAGLYDARNGWLQTRDRNRYEAVQPVEF